MTRRVIVELSLAEARALSRMAGNTGDYADAMEAVFPNFKNRATAERAVVKLDEAIREAQAPAPRGPRPLSLGRRCICNRIPQTPSEANEACHAHPAETPPVPAEPGVVIGPGPTSALPGVIFGGLSSEGSVPFVTGVAVECQGCHRMACFWVTRAGQTRCSICDAAAQPQK